MRRIAAAVLSLGLIASSPVAALEVGILQLHRPAGQPPYAEIALSDSAAIDPTTIRARLATPEGYRVAGMRYSPALRSISITPHAAADGRVVLRLENLPSSSEVGELDLLVLVGDRLSLSLNEYRVDLRGVGREFAPATAGTRLAAAKASAPGSGGTRPPAASTSTQAAGTAVQAPARTAASIEEGTKLQIEQALAAWARAWSERSVDAYLASYVEGYRPPGGGMSHADWVKQRRQRIASKQAIEVAISGLQLRDRGDAVVATFQQRYRGDELVENSRKRIVLTRQQDRWLIQEEAELR